MLRCLIAVVVITVWRAFSDELGSAQGRVLHMCRFIWYIWQPCSYNFYATLIRRIITYIRGRFHICWRATSQCLSFSRSEVIPVVQKHHSKDPHLRLVVKKNNKKTKHSSRKKKSDNGFTTGSSRGASTQNIFNGQYRINMVKHKYITTHGFPWEVGVAGTNSRPSGGCEARHHTGYCVTASRRRTWVSNNKQTPFLLF